MGTNILAKKSFKLTECLDRIVDNRGKTPPLSETGIELLEVNAIVEGRKAPAFENVRKFVLEETYANWFRSGHPRQGDTLISTVGAIGRVAYVQDERGCIAQNIVSLRPKMDVLDGEFLYYFLSSSEVQHRLLSLNIGVAQPSLKVPHLLSLEIELPPIPAQRRIAGILSAYDELIENSQQRIKILESMARALYREWFVYFRYPGHESVPLVPSVLGDIPHGWEVKKLGEVTQFKSGFAFKGESLTADGPNRLVTIKNVQDGVFIPECTSRMKEIPEKMPSFCMLNDGDILLSLTGNVGRVCLVFDGPFLLNQRVSKLVPVEETDRALIYCMFRDPTMLIRLEQISNGVAQQNLSPIAAARLDCIHPPVDLRLQFSNLSKPLLQGIVQSQSAIQNLRTTRDALLPRLLSGQIDVEAIAS